MVINPSQGDCHAAAALRLTRIARRSSGPIQMSGGAFAASGGPDSDESRQHAGYHCMGCKHTWSTLFALGQHQGSPYMRGTTCGLLASAAELRNVPRANLATGQAMAVPIYRQGTRGGQ